MFENLSHNHFYVKKNALVCLISIIENFGLDVLPNNIVDILKDLIEKDQDLSTRRNAYIALTKVDPKESLIVTKELLNTNDINELGDLFTLAIVNNIKNLCMLIKEKSKLVKLLLDLSSHKSHSVLFEIGSTLLSITSNPEIVRHAVNILCNLLVEQKDNNTLIIIIKKLLEIKKRHKDILEEQIVSFVRILDSNCTNELRKFLFEIISDLIRGSNINSVFEIFISDFVKMRTPDTDSTIEFKNSILNCMFENIIKFSSLNKTFPNFLIDKCLTYDSKNTFINEQITIIKELFVIYPESRKDFLLRILTIFDDIANHQILQACIWILGEYTNDIETFKKIFDKIIKNLGDLNFELKKNKIENDNINSNQIQRTITRNVILPDGTYGTETIIVNSAEANKQNEVKFLRKFVLETNFFFSTNLAVSLTRMVLNIGLIDSSENKEIFNSYYYNTILILISFLKLDSEKIYKDPDNISRINMCIQTLTSGDAELCHEFLNAEKSINTKEINKKDDYKEQTINKLVDIDEAICFRHVKQYDADNMETGEDDIAHDDTLKDAKNKINSNNSNKFTEVLTGSEDPLQIEAIVEIFTFDLVIEFYVRNTSKDNLQNIVVELFAPSNLEIIERAPPISLSINESKIVRSSIKFSSTSCSYLFGQVTYANSKGYINTLNLSGINIDLLHTVASDISESNFRKLWTEYNWEHNVILISRKKYNKILILDLLKSLLKLLL